MAKKVASIILCNISIKVRKKKRLHFHGIFYIPEGTLSGEMEEVNSFNFTTRRRQITKQNSFFAKRFGRNDFERIEDKNRIGDALAYIMKYIEKSGEKIVYSRGLAQYFISDSLSVRYGRAEIFTVR